VSIDKLLSQAEKFLDKGKKKEAIEKLKEVLRSDPDHQQAAGKLAQAYIETEQPEEAAKIFEKMAAKASDAGRAQVAVALLKQALDYLPDNINLLTKISFECENIGKLSEAGNYGQRVLNYYLARKKYIEALPICGLIARVSPKNEEIKNTWIEILMFISIDDKIIPALVFFWGPPGIVDKSFSVGGDPVTMSEDIYQKFVNLLSWYPRSVKFAYSLAWAAYKRGNFQDAFKFIRECFRRDPDFTLNMILLARIFSEQKKLDECFFIYKYIKDKMPLDRNVDMATLNHQLNSFLEKNGWITFNEGMGDAEALVPEKFLEIFISPNGEAAATESNKIDSAKVEESVAKEQEEVSGILLSSGEHQKETAEAAPTNEAHVEDDEGGIALPSFGGDGDNESEILLTSGEAKAISPPMDTPMPIAEPEPLQELFVDEKNTENAKESKNYFDPFEHMSEEAKLAQQDVSDISAQDPVEDSVEDPVEKTEIFSPIDVLKASTWRKDDSVLPKSEESDIPDPTQVFAVEDDVEVIPETILTPEVKPVVKFVPIPDADEPVAAPVEEVADRGTDLLLMPAKEKTIDVEENKTEQFVKELESSEISVENLLRKGERFLAKRNYYLARKSFRQALVFGAEEEFIKEKLRSIRAMEMPDGMYTNISSDLEPTSNVDELIEALEVDFEIDDSIDRKEFLGKISRTKFNKIMKNVDGKTCLDLGIAFYEMGLYHDAENVFLYASAQNEELQYDAHYLMAESMVARKDFSGAVNILKTLILDREREEKEKLPAYYLLGETFEKMSQPQRSKKYFKKIADINSSYRDVKEKLGLI